MKILNFGSLNIDYVYNVSEFVRAGETISALSTLEHPGGKGLNQAVAAARAGSNVFFAGNIGEDGLFLKELLENSGADAKYLKINKARTGNAIIQIDKDGENCIIVSAGANALLDEAYITQIPVGIILYEMKKGLNKRFFQKKHKKRLIFLSEYGIIRLYFIR